MRKEDFAQEFNEIHNLNQKYRNELEERLRNLLLSAQTKLGGFFISKGFIREPIKNKITSNNGNYYYDPKTKVGVKLDDISFVFLDNDYNSIPVSIVYKCKDKFLPGEKGILFFFRKEEPEDMYKRFKKYMGKTELRRMKSILRTKYPKEMLIDDRSEKMNNINILNEKPSN